MRWPPPLFRCACPAASWWVALRMAPHRDTLVSMNALTRVSLALAVPCTGMLGQPHDAAHESRTARDSLAAMVTVLTTTVSPALDGRARTEVLATQPMVVLRGARWNGALQYAGMANFERWTMPDGEPVAGIWGEGFVDRRHPHTVLHEAMATGTATLPHVRASLSLGRGVVPFGTDDPMLRPFTKYPANHHLAQSMERIVAVIAARPAPWLAVEVATFNGDEPLSPTAAPQWGRVGDSRAARATLWPLPTLEVQASVAAVRSPEFVRAEGLDHQKQSASARWTPKGKLLTYALAEWAQTGEAIGGRQVLTYGTALLETLARSNTWTLALRAEQTSRPEDERLLDPFRTSRPPNHLTIQGVTRWRIATVQVARVLPATFRTHASLFVEGARAALSPLLRPVLLDPRNISGANVAWHVTLGLRAGLGSMSARAGRYGVAAGDAATNVSLGMTHDH